MLHMTRPTNDQYFLAIAKVVSSRATCYRRKVGAVIVDNNNYILSTGYNAVPAGFDHCIDIKCPGALEKSGEGLHKCISRHAEDIALMKCRDINAIHTIYCTTSPCISCTRRLLDTSCKRIVFSEKYPHTDSVILWESLGREWCYVPS